MAGSAGRRGARQGVSPRRSGQQIAHQSVQFAGQNRAWAQARTRRARCSVMLGAKWSARAVIVSATAASLLAGAAAVALPMLPSSHTRSTAVVATGGPSATSSAGEGAYPTDDVVAPVVTAPATDVPATTVVAPPITPATRPVAAVKKT